MKTPGPTQVNWILYFKGELARGRDDLWNLLRDLRKEIKRLEKVCRRSKSKQRRRELQKYRSLEFAVLESIETTNGLIKPPSEPSLLRNLKTMFELCAKKIKDLLRDSKLNTIFLKFDDICNKMIVSTEKLHSMVCA